MLPQAGSGVLLSHNAMYVLNTEIFNYDVHAKFQLKLVVNYHDT